MAVLLVRYALPIGILIAGIVVLVVASDAITRTLGIALIGVAGLVALVNVLARLSISSQNDRDREQRDATNIRGGPLVSLTLLRLGKEDR